MHRPVWTPEEVQRLHDNKALFIDELEPLFPGRSAVAIGAKRRSEGLMRSSAEKATIHHRSGCHLSRYKIPLDLTLEALDNAVYQVLMGSLLGDGGVSKLSTECHFEERHGLAQMEYLQWKAKILKVFYPREIKPRKHGKWKSSHLTTCSHPIFTKLRSEMYTDRLGKDGKSMLPEHIGLRLDLLGLLVWYLDDGTSGYTPNASFSSHAHLTIAGGTWPLRPLERLITQINGRLDLRLYVKPSDGPRDMNHFVHFSNIDRNAILPQWHQLADQHGIPRCMDYKMLRRCGWKQPVPRRFNGVVRRSDGVEFKTQIAAARSVGLKTTNSIRSAINGERSTVRGFGWEYIERDALGVK